MTPDDPTDATIEAALRAAPAGAWAALWSAADELEGEVDGQAPDVAPATARVVTALYEAGAIVAFDWAGWEGYRTYREPGALDRAPVADAARMATAIVRGDRFAEGTIAAALADGTLLAALRRLRHWLREERSS